MNFNEQYLLVKNTILTSTKLDYINISKVDICDTRNRVLLEVSAGDKNDDKIHVQDYYKEHDFIRICASEQKNAINAHIAFR